MNLLFIRELSHFCTTIKYATLLMTDIWASSHFFPANFLFLICYSYCSWIVGLHFLSVICNMCTTCWHMFGHYAVVSSRSICNRKKPIPTNVKCTCAIEENVGAFKSCLPTYFWILANYLLEVQKLRFNLLSCYVVCSM